MRRFCMVVKKELICTKENIVFNVATITAPLFFLAIFTFMLSDGVSFPFHITSGDRNSAFIKSVEEYAAPNGIHYFELVDTDGEISDDASHDSLDVVEEFEYENGVLSGSVIHYINDVNQNTLKNSRNRIDGALVDYINKIREAGNINIVEHTVFEEDIPWNAGFGTSIFVFGIILSGLFFGALSIVCEYDNQTTTLLRLSPYPVWYVLSGKLVACLLNCFISGGIYYFAYTILFHKSADRFGAMLLIGLLVYIAFVSVGMMLGIALKTSVVALVASMGLAFLLWILGGGFGPLSFFGKVANVLADINPATYMVNSMKWCFFGGTANMNRSLIVITFFTVAMVIINGIVYTRWTVKQEG